MQQKHLTVCTVCTRAWSPSFDTECPYCRNAREKEEQRKAKEQSDKNDLVKSEPFGS